MDYQQPVPGFPIQYQWQENAWLAIFDEQVKLIRQEIKRALASKKRVIYLSCPISSRGGSHHSTNVDIALFTERQLLSRFGDGIWILNPVRYQLESPEGTGLIHQHIKTLGLAEDILTQLPSPQGGDYMRMWTKVLVEDNDDNLGNYFSGYYFLGAEDTRLFFAEHGGNNASTNIRDYYAQKKACDDTFSPDIQQFLLFYLLKASANFSLGCHDEWNILVKLNSQRKESYGVADLIPGYFEGRQLSLDTLLTSDGYGKDA